jgi:hypothetical protein
MGMESNLVLLLLFLPAIENFAVVPKAFPLSIRSLRADPAVRKSRWACPFMQAGALPNEDEWYDSDKVRCSFVYWIIFACDICCGRHSGMPLESPRPE